MNGTVHDLVGAWRLERWSMEYEDGRPAEFPLGPDARGMLLYTPGGRVSATLMSVGQPSGSLAYAGRYDVRGGAVYHSIEIATDPTLVGLTTTRHIAREGDVLTLSGPDFHAGTARSQKIVWRRLS
ncbi:Lipocalin-like domain-containing protein [Rhodospirillales bacterium URHD0017]|nr:Lipocalin-like domain-containing protein [Rhodospirillales bacterium URHD0017]